MILRGTPVRFETPSEVCVAPLHDFPDSHMKIGAGVIDDLVRATPSELGVGF